MEASKKYMQENGYNNRISFNDLSSHTVKLLKEKEDTIPDGKGGTVKGMKYLVEEAGEAKEIFTGSIGLIAKLANCEAGDVVTIKMGKANNKSFYTVTKADGSVVGEDDDQIADDVVAPEQANW